MTLGVNKPYAARLTENGPLHVVKPFHNLWLVACRGFVLRPECELDFSDSKPDCKACMKMKQR